METENNQTQISIDDVKKVEITIGEIKTAEKVENADRLLRLVVNFGDHERQIVSGIAEQYTDPSILVGRRCAFFTNLAPRTIKNLESNGMILAAADRENGILSLLFVEGSIPPGTKVS